MRTTHFVVCAPGLEPLLHAEARALGLPRLEQQVGGVRFEGERPDAWRANLWLRTAVRVLERVERREAADADALYRVAREVEWSRWLAQGATLRVDAQVRDSALTHSRFVEQRVKDAIVDRLREERGERPSVDLEAPDLRVHAHLSRDRLTLSVDTSGDSLHLRGWRRAQGRAPLAENLAAALVLASDWDRRAPLIDPFCGSGTVLVEAAHLAMGRAPGLDRRFAFEGWPGHDAAAWARMLEEARAGEQRPRKLRLVGRDRDPERIEDARANAVSAGVEEMLELDVGDALAFGPRPGWNAWIVTNPPYGERVGEGEDLVGLYRGLGELLRTSCAGYELALLSGNPRLARALGLRFASRQRVLNGGLECEILRARLHD